MSGKYPGRVLRSAPGGGGRQHPMGVGMSVMTNWRICPSVLPEMAVTRSAGDLPIRARAKFGFTDKLDSGPKVCVTEIGGV